MLPAASLSAILARAQSAAQRGGALGERLVSLVFSPPPGPLWQELNYTVAHLNRETGEGWDLFFIGVPAVPRQPDHVMPQDWAKHFRPDHFNDVVSEIYEAQKHALRAAGRDPSAAWRFSGTSTLVSFMCYAGRPDWLSLVAVNMEAPGRPALTLREVADRLGDWSTGTVDRDLSPGLGPPRPDAKQLRRALAASAGRATVSGVSGNAAYALIGAMFL